MMTLYVSPPKSFPKSTKPLPNHYQTLTKPLPNPYQTTTKPLPNPYQTLTQPLQNSYQPLPNRKLKEVLYNGDAMRRPIKLSQGHENGL